MKDRLQNFALSLCLLLFLLSGCSQISNTEPVPGSHSDTPAPAIYSESVAGPSQEVRSEQPTAQPDPIDPIGALWSGLCERVAPVYAHRGTRQHRPGQAQRVAYCAI